MGQMTVGFPVSPLTPATFLLVGLSGMDLGAHQRFTIPLLLAASVAMVLAASMLGVFAAEDDDADRCGAGYSGDRIEPAVELAEQGALDYLVFECLAERTIALAQQERRRDPARGYDPLLEARMRGRAAGVPRAAASASSPTWARPTRCAAAARGRAACASARPARARIAAVLGDDVLDAGTRRATS